MNKRKKRFEDLLPKDDELFSRSKGWAKLFEKYSENEDEHPGINLNEIPFPSDEDSEGNEDDEVETIQPSEFEDNVEQDDPNFDVVDVFNNTKKIVAKRKEMWHRTGADQLMDSFFLMDKYTDKVDDWIQKNADYFSNNLRRRERCCNGAVPCIDEVQIKDHLYEENGSHDSFESVDTAKYILSNRKKQRTRVRTMTIKRYCFSRKRMEELERESFKRTANDSFKYDECSEFPGRMRSNNGCTPACSESRLRKYRSKHPACGDRKSKSEYKRKTKKRVRPNSPATSLVSSCLSDNKIECHEQVPYKMRLRKRSKLKTLPELIDSSEPSTLETTSEIEEVIPFEKQNCEINPDSLQGDNNVDSLNSESRFCPENVVNSTALSEKQNIRDKNIDKVKLPAIEDHISISSGSSWQVPDSVKTPSKDLKRSLTPSPIVIYDPGDTNVNENKSIVNGKVIITSKILEETIGSEFANIYLGEKKDFSISFDSQAKILFYPPEQNIETSDSEADLLETLSSNTRGRIIVQIVGSKESA